MVNGEGYNEINAWNISMKKLPVSFYQQRECFADSKRTIGKNIGDKMEWYCYFWPDRGSRSLSWVLLIKHLMHLAAKEQQGMKSCMRRGEWLMFICATAFIICLMWLQILKTSSCHSDPGSGAGRRNRGNAEKNRERNLWIIHF